jgi:hypothetical protein
VIDDALRALEPQLGPPESEPAPLERGIMNRDDRLRLGGRDRVVRLPGKDTDVLGIDREAERECLVTAFVGARPVSAEELRTRLADPGRPIWPEGARGA